MPTEQTSGRASDAAETSPRAAPYASTAVQLGAAALLGGGFYYGITKQKRMEQQEEAKAAKKKRPTKKSGQSVTPAAVAGAAAAQDKVPVIRETTFLERQLGLHRPVTPNAAAMKALIGGTIVSVSGCAVLVLGLAAALGVRNVTEFRERMEDVFPRMRNNVARAFNVKPKPAPSAQDLAAEEAEMQELAAIFSERGDQPRQSGDDAA